MFSPGSTRTAGPVTVTHALGRTVGSRIRSSWCEGSRRNDFATSGRDCRSSAMVPGASTEVAAPAAPVVRAHGAQTMEMHHETGFRSRVAGCLALGGLAVRAQSPTDWPAVGGDLGGMKFAPIDEITPANVARLTPGVDLRARRAGRRSSSTTSCTSSAGGNVVALNADTGTEAWKFHAESGDAGRVGPPRHDLLARHAAACPARARHDQRRQAGAARCQDRAARARRRRHRSRERHHEPDPGRRGVHHRFARGRLQEPRDFSRSHRRAQSVGHPGRPARIRSADGQGSVALPHRAAARRTELRYVGPQRLAGPQRAGLLAAADGRHRERPRVRGARQCRRPELRQQPARRQPLRGERRRARSGHGQVQVALPGDPPRHLRLGSERAADVRRGQSERPADSRRSCR